MTCGRRLIAFAILLSALMSGIAAPPARAQTWEGTVEVSVNSLKFDEEGEAVYKVRLSEPPTGNKWWVRVFVDGAARSEGNYKGYEWVPSVGFEFNKDDWDQWREIRVIKTENAKENVMFSHEVWDHENNCPVHNVGQVTTGPKGSGNKGGDGGNTDGGNTDGGNTDGGNTDGGNTGGSNTDGDNTGGDNTGGDNTGGDNTGGGNTGGGNTGGGNTGGDNTGGGGNDGVGTDSLQNNAPVLDDPGTLTIEENVGSTTRPAENVGSPVTASDADNDPLTFTLEGAEAQFFSIGRTSGQIMTRSGAVYDREAKESYTVTVKVSDGRASDTVDATISVTDVSERPRAPAAPKVRLAPEDRTGLSVIWTAPSNRGRPPIESYDLQYRAGPDDTWIDGPQDVTETSALILNIQDFDEELPYEVRVRATNADGDSDWSPPGRLGRGLEGDTVQKSWIVRFARTVGSQMLNALDGRFDGGSETQVSVAGMSAGGAAYPGPGFGWGSSGNFGTRAGWDKSGFRGAMPGRARSGLPPGSSFQIGAGDDEKGEATWTAWGRFGIARFDARKKPVPLFGDVSTAVIGADVAQDRWLGGLAVSISEGAGVFELAGDEVAGKSKGRLVNLYGFARYRLTETIDVWGIVGSGKGKLNFRQEDDAAGRTDIGMRIVSGGVRGRLPSPDWGLGIDLAVKADAMWVQAESDAAGDLVAAQGEATRLRLIGEGSRAFEVGGGTLTLTGEGGLRHDGGDADKGVGILVGGGVRYRARGYTVRGHAHGVLAHAEKGFGEWGITGEVRINPGQLGRGFFLTVAPGWGAGPGGIERMQSAPGGAPGVDGAQAFAAEGRLNTEIGYGLRAPVGAGLLTPHAGLSLSMRGTQQWRAGARWRIAPQTVFGFEGTRDVTRGPEPAAHSILFRANARW